ncbi:MAG: FprA family A-type flavoprotein [Clostridia bacterium]|nr:FprA family A-type flavoprotein [Clostridia bacterium]
MNKTLFSVAENIYYIGVDDRDIDLFEGQYRTAGMCYNSYVIVDEKVAVLDGVDARFGEVWLSNISEVLGGRTVDYFIVQHMEPDHSASVARFVECYPEATVVATKQAFMMMEKYFGVGFAGHRLVAEEGQPLSLGAHTLHFVKAPMVHWPEVMVTYEESEKILFSADAFGKFGLYSDDDGWVEEARRYYIGIVGKYGKPVCDLLAKASALDIETICPLHGPVLRAPLDKYLSLYQKWATYTPEEDGVLIAYTSVYGNTRRAVEFLADALAVRGVKVTVRDLARSDISEVVANAFRYPKVVLATTTYNGDVFPFMRDFILHLTERNFSSRTVALIENGSWAPMACRVMRKMLEGAQNITYTADVKIHAAPNGATEAELLALADALI